jgi:hypothetical protein
MFRAFRGNKDKCTGLDVLFRCGTEATYFMGGYIPCLVLVSIFPCQDLHERETTDVCDHGELWGFLDSLG